MPPRRWVGPAECAGQSRGYETSWIAPFAYPLHDGLDRSHREDVGQRETHPDRANGVSWRATSQGHPVSAVAQGQLIGRLVQPLRLRRGQDQHDQDARTLDLGFTQVIVCLHAQVVGYFGITDAGPGGTLGLDVELN